MTGCFFMQNRFGVYNSIKLLYFRGLVKAGNFFTLGQGEYTEYYDYTRVQSKLYLGHSGTFNVVLVRNYSVD
jgi:hypothetical protein